MRLFWWQGAVVLVLAVVFAAGQARAYEVLTPPLEGKTQINSRRAQSHLVIKAGKDEAGSLRVGRLVTKESPSGEEGTIRDVKVKGSWEKDGAVYLHYFLELERGGNTFIINPGEKELNIRYQRLRTLLKVDPDDPNSFRFHDKETVPASCGGCHTEELPADSGLDVEKLRKNTDFSPLCFSCHRQLTSGNLWLHGPAAQVACMTCHRREVGSDRIATLVGSVEDTCYSCHINRMKWVTGNYVHGPAATGDCTVCHDSHGDDHPYMLWADPKFDICIACHKDKQEIRTNRRGYIAHGILEAEGCAACHNPHASNHRFQLADEINESCVNCHRGLKGIKDGHPVGKHPLAGKPDPRRKGRELACTGCHNPHGGEYQYLLIGNLLGGHVCSKCHN
ncbi:MAG: cytochrome c3 family protein [Thermodesulfobacteriota bacterium]